MFDSREAYRWYRKAADQGYARAQFALGLRYDTGQGVARDFGAAYTWYLEAARQGHARAQFNIGLMYASGHGARPDLLQACAWFQQAERGGVGAAAKYIRQATSRMTPAQLEQAQRLALETSC
jgi:hypothetical protein